MGTGLEVAAFALAAAGSAYSASETRAASADQRKARKEASAIKSATQKSADAEKRKQQMRELRVKRARLLQSSENTGVTGSSGEIGAIAGQTSQVGSNFAFMSGQAAAADGITNVLAEGESKAQGHLSNAQVGGFVSSVAGSAFSMWAGTKGGQESLNSFFNG